MNANLPSSRAPDDIVLPVTWQRSEAAGETAPVTLGDLNIGERDNLRDAIKAELARRAEARAPGLR